MGWWPFGGRRRRSRPARALTVERCGSCGAESERPFREGDCLFAGESGACGKCGGGRTSVERIFGEPDE